MGQETTRLREEIERTREDLTRDVDRLAEKTSPSRIIDRRIQRTRGRLAGLKDKIMGSPGYDDGYGYPAGYGSTAHRGGGQSRVESATHAARDAAGQVAQSAREGVSAAREQVSQAGDRAQDAVQEAADEVREQTAGNPLAAGLLAFGVGWLVSSLMPASEAETRAARRAGEVAREHVGPVVEQARQSAQEVGEHLRDHAQQSAAEVRDSAQEAAAQVRDSAQEATESVREEARTSVSTSG
ncbi:MAG TPA: DUF3618 domain-containing protein [Kineosporiaceae bacterium]